MPTAEATKSAPTPTGTTTEPRSGSKPSRAAGEDRPGAGIAAVSEPRWRRWCRESLLDAQLIGFGLVLAVVIGLVAAII